MMFLPGKSPLGYAGDGEDAPVYGDAAGAAAGRRPSSQSEAAGRRPGSQSGAADRQRPSQVSVFIITLSKKELNF